MIYGELPTGSVVMAGCDSEYFIQHGASLVYSAERFNKNVHFHIINPTDEALSLGAIVSSTSTSEITFTYTDVDFSQASDNDKRVYYSCVRFLAAPVLLQTADKLLIVDVDALIMNDFEYFDADVAYFPRESLPGTVGWEAEGTKVLASAIQFSKGGEDIALAIAKQIQQLPLQWFVDQVAIHQVLQQVPDRCQAFGTEFLDWEFDDNSVVWTGKGDRKFTNQKYVETKRLLDEKMDLAKYKDVIIKPRLDIPFKKFGLEIAKDTIPDIRKHWANFVDKKKGADTLVIETPNWTVNNTICNYFKDTQPIYVPHKEKEWWGGGDNCRYYMQTVFPWLFTIDDKGMFGGSSYKETFDPEVVRPHDAFETLQNYMKAGNTKFKDMQGQREWEFTDEPYVLVPLQLPHDETIKYHSDVTVPEMVKAMCEWADNGGMKVIFKGHPVNLGAMAPLMEIIEQYDNVQYVTDYPINPMIDGSCAVFVVNSGTGQESMLYDRPVVIFGRCDYEGAVIKGDIKDLAKTWESVLNDDSNHRKTLYRRWFGWFVDDIAFDTRNQ